MLSVTRVIFSVFGYNTSDIYFSIFAKFSSIPVWVTTVSRLPIRDSQIIKIYAPLLRTYTESIFSRFPDSHGIWVSFINYLFVSSMQTKGTQRIVGALVYFKNILHSCPKLYPCLSNTPFLDKTQFKLVFSLHHIQ